jgi:hypothetical protein
MKKRYVVLNIGCDDETSADFIFTKKQAEFLGIVFEALNKHSTYGCMPKIYINEVEEKKDE